MKRQINLEEAVGKTILKAEEYGNDLLIVFDDSFIEISSTAGGWDSNGILAINQVSYSLGKLFESDTERLKEAGVLSAEEAELVESRLDFERRERDRRAEGYERAQYEALKKKFEGKSVENSI